MNLTVFTIEGKGDLENEVVWLDVLDVLKLHYYMISDSTYASEHNISNELRHLFWFPKTEVKKGDWIALHTKNGSYQTTRNKRETTTHHFYWNLGRTIWNKEGDAAVLFKLSDWHTTKA